MSRYDTVCNNDNETIDRLIKERSEYLLLLFRVPEDAFLERKPFRGIDEIIDLSQKGCLNDPLR